VRFLPNINKNTTYFIFLEFCWTGIHLHWHTSALDLRQCWSV
jgi:hypothetical protein